MSIVDLHPEDLIDKLARGELSKSEQERLRAHFAVCGVCRFEHSARENFEAALTAVKTLHVPPFLASGAIERRFSSAAIEGPLHKSPSPSRLRTSHLVAAIAAALMITSAAAGAGIWPRLRPFFFRTTRPEPAPLAQAPISPVGSQPPASRPSIGGPEPEHKIDVLDSLPAQSTPAQSTSGGERERPAREPPALGTLPSSAGATPASLFSNANAARRHGDGALAVQLYRELQHRFSRSSEAHLSRAILGRLLLDRGNAGLALKELNEYLSSGGGELEKETLVGKALALQKLGRRDAETAVWNEVLEKHPDSVYCEQARARLSALSRP